MKTDTAICPFCNAPLPTLASALTDGQRNCPRCGEPVPAARWHVDTSIASGEADFRPKPGNAAASSPPGKRKTALIILGIMIAMGVVSLSYALWTTGMRRARHPWMPKKEEPLVQRRPLELPGLAYLPKNCQLVAGVQIAAMLADKSGVGTLLNEPRPLLLDGVLKQIPRSSGLTLAEIDHLVLGAAIDEHFPQAVMVVKTRSAYEPAKIAKLAKPATPPTFHDKPLFRYSLAPIGEALLWCVDDHTLLYVLRLDEPKAEHLSGLSAKPRPIDEVLPAPVRQVLDERLRSPQIVWAAGRLDQLGALKDWLPLAVGGKAEMDRVRQIKTFALGIAPINGLTLTGDFEMTDAKSAAAFKTFLEGIAIPGAKSLKVEVTPPDRKDQWVTWQVHGDVAALREFLNRGPDAKK